MRACFASTAATSSEELELARRLETLAAEHGLSYWRSLAEFTQGRVAAELGDAPAGIARMRAGIESMRAAGGLVGVPYLLCLLASAEIRAGRPADARAALAQAGQLVAGNGNALYAAEALCLEGELALAEGGGAAARRRAERSFVAGLRWRARRRLAGSSCAPPRAWRACGREGGEADRAFELLAPVHAGFDGSLASADVRQARALLDELRRPAGRAAE